MGDQDQTRRACLICGDRIPTLCSHSECTFGFCDVRSGNSGATLPIDRYCIQWTDILHIEEHCDLMVGEDTSFLEFQPD